MDPVQPKTVVVNGREYIVSKFLADTGLSVFVRLAKLLAEPIAKGAALGSMEQDSEAFAAKAGEVLSSLVLRLDEAEVKRTVEDLLSVVVAPGSTQPLADPLNPSRSTWRVHFQGRLADLGLVVYHSWRENFEDFLSVWTLVRGKLVGLGKGQGSQSPTT